MEIVLKKFLIPVAMTALLAACEDAPTQYTMDAEANEQYFANYEGFDGLACAMSGVIFTQEAVESFMKDEARNLFEGDAKPTPLAYINLYSDHIAWGDTGYESPINGNQIDFAVPLEIIEKGESLKLAMQLENSETKCVFTFKQ